MGEDRVSDGAPDGVIRVGYITGEPTPGRAPQLARIAEHPEIELSVIYAAQSIQARQWSVELPADDGRPPRPSLPLSRVLHHDYPITPQIWPLLERERFDVLVVAGWSVFAGQVAIAWARLRRVPYLIVAENHLREPRPGWVKGVKAVVLRQVVPQSSGSLVPGTLARTHAIRYGARPERSPCSRTRSTSRRTGRRRSACARPRRDPPRALDRAGGSSSCWRSRG